VIFFLYMDENNNDVVLIEEPNYLVEISKSLGLGLSALSAVLDLTLDGATVPFIARYRKEMTGNLDEDVIRLVLDLRSSLEKLFSAKRSALNSILEQGKLCDDLALAIISCKVLKEVEDIYEPYKRKKKTKADVAIEKGFGPIADLIIVQSDIVIPAGLLVSYTRDEIIRGACDIASQVIVDDVSYKKYVRHYFSSYGVVESDFVKKDKIDALAEKSRVQVHKFEIYDGFVGDVHKLKEYQVLALNRGEDLGLTKVKLAGDDGCFDGLCSEIIEKNFNVEPLKSCVKSAYKKIFTSIEKEIRKELTEKSHVKAVEAFQLNLYKLLMTKPQYGKNVLAIDPAFRTGCKICVLDKLGNPSNFDKVYLHNDREMISKIKDIISKFSIDVVVIGNGTGSNETFDLLTGTFEGMPFVIVNESGASVYSASPTAKKEFPNLDLTDRGTISIGRRFIDPLSELVKVPVESIGVGMYQHDIYEKLLKEKLEITIGDVVNEVGIQVNTASPFVLKFISGLTAKSAEKIAVNAPYKSRKGLKKVLSAKAYEQAVGFLRVQDSKEILDNTSIHPEQYDVAKYIFENNIISFTSNENKLKDIYSGIDIHTFNFIVESKKLIGQDLRKFDAALKIKKTISMDDVKDDDILDGVVRNIMQFGAFVDVGLKNDGLVHISELANKFVSDPNEIVSVGQAVRVKVLSIHKVTSKIQLSLKQVK
jgi:uncharacterized protein